MISNMVLFRTVMGPVTPATHSGCAPKTENMKAAMKDDNNTSETPYCCVVSIRSSEKAMPGSTLVRVRLYCNRKYVIWVTYLAKNISTIAGITL